MSDVYKLSLSPSYEDRPSDSKSRSPEHEWVKTKALMEQRIELIQTELRESKEREEALRRMNDALCNSLGDLAKERDNSLAVKAVKELEASALATVRDASQLRLSVQETIDTLREDNGMLKERIAELEKYQEQAKNRFDSATLELKERIIDFERENVGLRAQLSAKDEQIKELNKELRRQQEKDIDMLKTNVEKQLQTISNDKENNQSKLLELKLNYERETSQLRLKLEETQRSLDRSRVQTTDLERKLDETIRECREEIATVLRTYEDSRAALNREVRLAIEERDRAMLQIRELQMSLMQAAEKQRRNHLDTRDFSDEKDTLTKRLEILEGKMKGSDQRDENMPPLWEESSAHKSPKNVGRIRSRKLQTEAEDPFDSEKPQKSEIKVLISKLLRAKDNLRSSVSPIKGAPTRGEQQMSRFDLSPLEPVRRQRQTIVTRETEFYQAYHADNNNYY